MIYFVGCEDALRASAEALNAGQLCMCMCVCVVVHNLWTVSFFGQVVKTTGLQCLRGLFTSVAGPQGLTAQLNGQLISVSDPFTPAAPLSLCTIVYCRHYMTTSLVVWMHNCWHHGWLSLRVPMSDCTGTRCYVRCYQMCVVMPVGWTCSCVLLTCRSCLVSA